MVTKWALAQFAHLRGTNILVKNVNARVFTNQMWTDGQRTNTNSKTSPEQSAIFQLVQEINKTNVLTKFHDDKAKYVTSITRKTAPPPWQPYIYKTNLFTKFHDDWAKNVTSRVWRKPTNRPTNQPKDQPTNQQTNLPTNRQGKNNKSPTTILSSDNHLVDGPTDRPTDRPTLA
ncbi:hypothetical protein DPMN_114379 [Dreissena polymorpha]|uniref:Uncharacterized protein n=1 Tax=Dreissena polymorpha TaxID=45954 RepID=A0A9D4KJS5_DREPO|nr:hypothetical protein DPMN_114379 [Dreissena polymorpha]